MLFKADKKNISAPLRYRLCLFSWWWWYMLLGSSLLPTILRRGSSSSCLYFRTTTTTPTAAAAINVVQAFSFTPSLSLSSSSSRAFAAAVVTTTPTAGGSSSRSCNLQSSHQQSATRTGRALFPSNLLRQQSTSTGRALFLSSSSPNEDSINVNGEEEEDSSSDRFSSNKKAQERRREGQTGWTHSTPSETSSFWKESSSSAKKSSSSSSNELRTGWLHNTQSPSERQAQQQQKKDDSSSSSSTTTTPLARRRLQLAMKQQARNHRIIAPPAFHSTGTSTMVTTEHVISVPLVRGQDDPSSAAESSSNKERVDVYFSIVEKVDSIATDATTTMSWWKSLTDMSPTARAQAYVQQAALANADQLVLYLQGGPGFGAPTPVVGLGLSQDSSWAAAALDDKYSKVVLMDQRGTGRSTPVTKQTLQLKFPDLFFLDDNDDDGGDGDPTKTLESLSSSKPDQVARVETAIRQATDYLSNFRADNIVQDAEEIRDALLLPPVLDDEEENNATDKDNSNSPWGCALGQSFGGFCLMTYLSQVAQPPRICLFTGGMAPMLTPLDDVYASLWDRVRQRSLQYYEHYPGDVAAVKRLIRKLLQSPVQLPSGGTLTARRFLQLGLALGGTPSTFASLHALFASALVPTTSISSTATSNANDDDDDDFEFSRAFLKRIDSEQSFDNHPIYFWLHESIYANGPEKNCPTNWSAHRVYQTKCRSDDDDSSSDFDYTITSSAQDDRPTLFFGEHVFPWMTEDYAELSGLGLRAMAEALAAKTDWTPLYNAQAMERALQSGACRAAAAVYYDDLYVDFDACAKVFARNGGPLNKCNVWITNEYQHSGLRDAGATIFTKLHGMATGSIRIPS